MEIILSKQCQSLTGSLGQGFGYFIVNRKGRFYSVRSKHSVPPDGHWRFITTCAELAQSKLYLSDIRVSHQEFSEALSEAGRKIPPKYLSILLACWRKHKGYKSRGREGWLRKQDADDFIRYAW